MDMQNPLNESRKIVVKVDPELTELIPNFLENRSADVSLMHKALQAGDYETIERIGHGMKGVGAGFGFDAITEIGARIEKAAQDKNPDQIKNGIQELADYMVRLEVIYE